MGKIHELVLQHGPSDARAYVEHEDWPLIPVAADVLAEQSRALGITYSGFCMTALPHRKMPNDEKWRRSTPDHRFVLLVEPGELQINRRPVQFGVPYGSRARLILLYLQTRAMQTGCQEVELGRSMNDWL